MGTVKTGRGKRLLLCWMAAAMVAGAAGCSQSEPVSIEQAYINEN